MNDWVQKNRIILTSHLVLAGLFLWLASLATWLEPIFPAQAAASEAEATQASSQCDPLAPPTGNTINVDPAQASNLDDIVNSATTGDTILLADGVYNLNGDYLWFDTPGVTMRSASGNREAVILDGGYITTEIVFIIASEVTIADLTIKKAVYHPIHVTAGDAANTENTLIYNVHVMDPGQQAIKINPNGARTYFPDKGVVACSHIELTDAGRPKIWEVNGSCYTGGIDAHGAWGWVVRDNLIEEFWCDQGLSEHAIHFWTGSRDTLVERNTLQNNARGVGFGLGQSGASRSYADNLCSGASYVGHYDGIIRNNFIFQGRAELQNSQAGFECGICLEQACGAKVFHNSVVSTGPPFSSIEWRFANTNAEIINNLASHNLRERNGATATLSHNLTDAQLSLFVDGAGGNLHLAAGANLAIDQGLPIAAGMSADDIDSAPRDANPDLGADEYPANLPYSVHLPLLLKI